MATDFQLVIDCSDASRLVAFWAEALGYKVQDPPDGSATWREWYLSVGVPEEELGEGDCTDRIVDPDGAGPRIWFQQVPERKVVKNRLHLDLKVSGGRDIPIEVRKQRVDSRVQELTALGATTQRVTDAPEVDHYFVLMQDPEGNEFCVA